MVIMVVVHLLCKAIIVVHFGIPNPIGFSTGLSQSSVSLCWPEGTQALGTSLLFGFLLEKLFKCNFRLVLFKYYNENVIHAASQTSYHYVYLYTYVILYRYVTNIPGQLAR